MRKPLKNYTAHVTRDGRFWLVHIPEIDRYTQARNLREIDVMARDLVAIMEGIEPDSFELTVDITMPEAAAEHLRRAEHLRAEAAKSQSEAAAELRAAAAELRQSGIPLRDLGKLLGVSHQRADQLTKQG